jgi:hypothetical protein
VNVGQHLVDQREERRHHGQTHALVDHLPQDRPARQRLRRPPLAQRREDCRQDQRHEHQEASAEHHRERKEAIFDDPPDTAAFFRLHLPDGVERRLQFIEDAGRTHDQYDDADDDGQRPGLWPVGIAKQVRDRLRHLGPHGVADLAFELAAGGAVAEDHARDRQGDDQQWSDREQRVIRKRRPERRRLGIRPDLDGPLEQFDGFHGRPPLSFGAVQLMCRPQAGCGGDANRQTTGFFAGITFREWK